MQSEPFVDKAILPVQPSGAGAMPPISLDPPQWSSLQTSVCLSVRPQICFRMKSLVGIDQLFSELHICINRHSGKTAVELGVKGSTAKVIDEVVYVGLHILFRVLTHVWISHLYSNYTHVSFITQVRPLLNIGSKGPRSGSQVRVAQILFRMITHVWISHLYSNYTHIYHSSLREDPYLGQKVNSQGHRSG